MNSLSPIDKDLFHFSLFKTHKKTDLERLDYLLSQGANPNVVVNGQPIVLNFLSNNKLDLVEHLLPQCDFSLRFGGRSLLGFAAIGASMHVNEEHAFNKYITLFRSFVQNGADIHALCRPNVVAFNRPCVDVLFDALRCSDHTHGDVLLELLRDNIYPNESYWDDARIDVDDIHLPNTLPMCFNRWWKQMQDVRQNQRIVQALHNPCTQPNSRDKRKL